MLLFFPNANNITIISILQRERRHLNRATSPPGEARTDYDLYAVYAKGDSKKVLAGKLRVRTESPKTYPVMLVTMASDINTDNIVADLNNIYAPFAIKWDVTFDNSMEGRTDWDVEGDVPG